MWKQRLAEYLTAKSRHDDAERLFHRAQRTFIKLAKRVGDERAYIVAGVSLADNRSIRTYQEKERAFEVLRDSVRGAPFLDRMKAAVAVRCCNLPQAANDL